MSFSQELFMLTTSHGHYRNRVGAHNANEAVSILDSIYSDSRLELVANIELLRDAYIPNSTKRNNAEFYALLNSVVLSIASIREEPFNEVMDLVTEDLKEFSEYESQFTLEKIFNKAASDSLEGTPFSLAFEGITPAALYSATIQTQVALGNGLNGTLNSLLKGTPESEKKRMLSRIEQGFIQGQTNQEIIRSVFNKQSGSAETSKTRLAIDALVRTSTNSMGNQAHKIIAEKNSDLVQGYRNLAVWDSRISRICSSIALEFGDKVLPYDAFPPVPRHLRCRSLIVMALKPWNEVLKTGKVQVEDDQGTQSFFAAPTKETSAQITARLKKQGLTMDQINKYKRSFSGQTSKTTLDGFLSEQRDRGNIDFLNTFFGSKERAQMYINGEYKAKDLYNMESRSFIPLDKLREIEG
jgi:hypothetical protein